MSSWDTKFIEFPTILSSFKSTILGLFQVNDTDLISSLKFFAPVEDVLDCFLDLPVPPVLRVSGLIFGFRGLKTSLIALLTSISLLFSEFQS